jgi:hypothetical protein
MIYTYHWLHLPTKTTGTRQTDELTFKEFAELINRWNDQYPNAWLYWY